MLVYAYARYSTDKQTDSSIEQQFEEINKYAKRNNYKIINYYHDSAISGQKDDREQFQRMIDDCIKKKEVQAILVWKLDRFARNRYDSAMYKNKLKNVGIRVVSITQNIDDTPEGIILEGLLEAMDEYYCANLSTNVKRKLYQNAEQCKFNGGFPPLGYDIDENKNYVINEKEAKIVREMFDLYENGHSLIEITNIFNNKGYKTKKGTEFKKKSLYDMIGNERYAGYYIYSKSKNHNKRVERDDIIKIEDGIPAIISKERMKRIMDKRKKHKNYSNKEDYILSGLIVCDKCDKNYIGRTSTRKYKDGSIHKNSYYISNCEHKKTLKREYVEKIAIDCIKNQIINSKELDVLTNKLNELYLKRKDEDNTYIKELNIELNDVKKQLSNITDIIVKGLYTDDLKEKAENLENRRKDLEKTISNVKFINERDIITKDDVKNALGDDLKEFDTLDPNYKKTVIQKWIKEIRVTDTNISITLNLIGNIKMSLPGMAPRVRNLFYKRLLYNIK